MHRPSREEVDDQILDSAAQVLAKMGPADGSVQAIADATGYSKSAVLKRFGTKQNLLERVVERCVRLAHAVVDAAGNAGNAAARDERAVVALTDAGLRHPGFVATLIAAATGAHGADALDGMDALGTTVLRAFDVDPETSDIDRQFRVVGALAAVSILCLLSRDAVSADQARPRIVRIALDALHEPTDDLAVEPSER